LHSQLTGAPNAVSQAAFEAALKGEPPEVQRMCDEFKRRREVLVAGLRSLGLPCEMPRGAFYAFPDVSAWLDGRGSTGFCEEMLEEVELAIVPGSAFGVDAHVRLSYATSVPVIEQALERMARFLAKRRPRSTSPAGRGA
jgi:aspartate/methionine/tyrosine aminotransferase